MKTLKTYLKPISYLLTFLILLQGCVIYKKNPSTIDEAVKANTNVRIETKDDKTIKFKRIEFENEQYFGINNALKFYNETGMSGLVKRKKKMEIIKTLIELNDVQEIKIKDKTMSTVVPIAAPLVIIGGVIGIAAATWSPY